MGPIAVVAVKKTADAVIQEAIDEVRGTSTKKWGIAVVAFAVGMVVAVIIVRRRGGRLAIELDEVDRVERLSI